VNVKDNVIFFFFLSNRVMIQQLLERFYMNKLPDNNETLEQRTVCYMYTLLAVRASAGLKARLREAAGLGLSRRRAAVVGVRRGGRLTGRLEGAGAGLTPL
jgi:hypothetical protein